MQPFMKELLLKIQALKESIDALHPLDASTLGRIEQNFVWIGITTRMP